eukprot:TRINITY_DN16199_c0_g1_i5.p1 TRINITY_DN16199_c0_g1~~TRINITY_DN16199_c0_g1_i5.p1  ORF type:complete len:979 (-),score=131.24 TRINITY_DN16199_c0_g1_i5:1859-4795(-)
MQGPKSEFLGSVCWPSVGTLGRYSQDSYLLRVVAASLAGTAVCYVAHRILITLCRPNQGSPADLDVEIVSDVEGQGQNNLGTEFGSRAGANMPGQLGSNAALEGFSRLGGVKDVCDRLMQLVELPLVYPLLAQELRIRPPSGILLKGPPGCGKTAIVQCLAAETGARLITLYSVEVKRPHYGDTEKKLRRYFQKALESAPSILLIDEIDALGRKRGGHNGDQSALSQVLTLMDQLSKQEQVVVVIATTNQPDSLDMALRRPGRLEQEIQISHPDEAGRLEIANIHCRNISLDKSVDLKNVARDTPGFTGADLQAICKEAELQCRNERLQSCQQELQEATSKKSRESILRAALTGRKVRIDHFDSAINKFENPSALRDIAVEVPDTCWEDIGGLEDVKRKLKELVQYPIEFPDLYSKFGRKPSKGLLLFGPPGCGKTLLAKAVAKECQANFISIKGPELQSKWHGQSAANVRWIFSKARQVAPCVLFFDEIDSIAKERVGGSDCFGSRAGESMLTQLLVELDGIQNAREGALSTQKTVFVIAATNRPEVIDHAMLRPGRFDELLLIPLPDTNSRKQVFQACLRKTPVAADVSFEDLVSRTEGFSGADVAEVCNKACMLAIRENIQAKVQQIQQQKENLLKQVVLSNQSSSSSSSSSSKYTSKHRNLVSVFFDVNSDEQITVRVEVVNQKQSIWTGNANATSKKKKKKSKTCSVKVSGEKNVSQPSQYNQQQNRQIATSYTKQYQMGKGQVCLSKPSYKMGWTLGYYMHALWRIFSATIQYGTTSFVFHSSTQSQPRSKLGQNRITYEYDSGLKQIKGLPKSNSSFPQIPQVVMLRWKNLAKEIQKCKQCGNLDPELIEGISNMNIQYKISSSSNADVKGKVLQKSTEKLQKQTPQDLTKLNEKQTGTSSGTSQSKKQQSQKDVEDPVPYVTKAHFEDALKGARKSVPDSQFQKYQDMAKSLRELGSFDNVGEAPFGMYL